MLRRTWFLTGVTAPFWRQSIVEALSTAGSSTMFRSVSSLTGKGVGLSDWLAHSSLVMSCRSHAALSVRRQKDGAAGGQAERRAADGTAEER